MTKNTQSKLSNIEVIRCFAIVSLVMWHSLCVYVGWCSYLPDITNAVKGSSITFIYRYVTTILFMPDANMPLFVIVAAYVYAYLWNKGVYVDTKTFLNKKTKRLVIPYFVIGTIVVFTIYDWNPLQILTGNAHHLWFCAMLFWCFWLIRIYQKVPPPWGILIAACGFGLQIHPVSYDILGIVKGLSYFPYFLFGYYLYNFLPVYKRYKWNRIIAVSFWLLMLVSYTFFKRVEPICYAYCFMIFVLIPDNIYVPNWVKKINAYSFGIYVFHEWFLWNAAHVSRLHPFIIDHQFLYPLLAFVIVFPFSMLLTNLSLKTRIGKYLLAG